MIEYQVTHALMAPHRTVLLDSAPNGVVIRFSSKGELTCNSLKAALEALINGLPDGPKFSKAELLDATHWEPLLHESYSIPKDDNGPVTVKKLPLAFPEIFAEVCKDQP